MKRALLIGCQTYGLQGVHHDLRAMKSCLSSRGFATTSMKEETATRAGILAAFTRLSSEAEADDAIVIYYSGHGGRIHNPSWFQGSVSPRFLHFLVPTDMAQSNADDFRGILDLELSMLVEDVTHVCQNVTLLLDCCHAARLVRSTRSRARALPDIWAESIESHLSRCNLQQVYTSNPHAVRLTAAGGHQSAYEDPSGELGGYFTEALIDALEQAGESPISWSSLGQYIREQVLVMEPTQRPELQGPIERLLFSTTRNPSQTSDRQQGLTLFYDEQANDRPSIRGGVLHGVVMGNIYAVHQLDDPRERLATARVTKVHAGISQVELSGDEPPPGAPLFPLREVFPERGVILDAGVPEQIVRFIESSRFLAVVPPDARLPMARVSLQDGALTIRDGAGRQIFKPIQQAGEVIERLCAMTRALTLRELREQNDTPLRIPFDIAWGKVVNGARCPLSSPSTLHIGERLFVAVTNPGHEPIYVNLFDVGISYRITLLNQGARSGFELAPSETWCFGQRQHGLVGVAPSWPDCVPTQHPAVETIVALVSDKPVDLSVLTGDHHGHRDVGQRTRLEQDIRARCLGGNRSSKEHDYVKMGYAVRHLDFELQPAS